MRKFIVLAALAGLLGGLQPKYAVANIAGGGKGSGPDVTVKDNGDGTVTLANGIVSIEIVKQSARLNAVNYTYTNGVAPETSEVLLGPRQYYYGGFMLGNGTYEYSLAADPATTGGNYGDVMLMSTTDNQGTMEVHFSMLRGSPGFYSTAVMSHRSQDSAGAVTAWGVVSRAAPYFNWISADDKRNSLIGEPSSKGVKVPNSPHEITVTLDGSLAGEYADKFVYGQDHADLRAWGWSSVGPQGKNIGMWMMTNMDFSDGGPLKRDVSVYPYHELNNSILTGELGMGSDGNFAQGEVWSKTCGPWFIYLNNVSKSVTDPKQAAQALYQDAVAQAEAEKKAWPYSWFKNPAYASASQRGSVTGRLVVKDAGNPNASSADVWVGLEQQPSTTKAIYDFQKWLKPYQYWVKTDASGSFTIPNIIAGDNYTLWAYGPAAAGTFLSQNQQGGNPPFECDVPATPFSVKVTGGGVTQLGDVTWTPQRIGPTVFELGFPNRKSNKFRHGDDYWMPGSSPKLGFPTPEWGGQMEFPYDFPDGMTYTVGKSQWPIDWNYVLPVQPDTKGVNQPCHGTINFDLAKAPAGGAKASLYLGCAGDDGGHVVISVNGSNLGTVSGASASPQPIDETGFNPAYFDDSSYHFCDHGPFSDERINFPASLLHAGANSITIQMNSVSSTAYLMVDYLRLELTGYIPPAPASVTAYPGNGRNLVRWPPVPGATSYSILRSNSPDTGFAPITTGFVGPVCGSGPGLASYVDQTVANGTGYYYRVQSTNPVGQSAPSPVSAATKPSADVSAGVPAAPSGLSIASSGHHLVALNWAPSPGANYYSIWRSTMRKDGVGGATAVGTTLLSDVTVEPSFTDNSPTDGKIYDYFVTACNAAGASGLSNTVQAIPLPPPPAAAPEGLAGNWKKTRNGPAITLSWSPVPGAIGYVIYRSAEADPSFQWPKDFLTALVETTYIDQGVTEKKAKVKGLNPSEDYSYQVTAVNAGGVSPSASIHVGPQGGG